MYWRTKLLTISLLLAAGPALATVCRLPGLDGFHDAAERAREVLPLPTSDVSQIAVYIEKDPEGGFYFHSNFISEGAEHPTKIGGEPDLLDVNWALQNIVWTESPSAEREALVREAYLSTAEIYVDKGVIESGATNLDFGARNRIFIVDAEAKTSTGGLVINRETPPPIYAERLSGCCLHGFPPAAANQLKQALKDVEISEDGTKLISLVTDSATASEIRSSRLKAIDAGIKASGIKGIDDLKETFRLQRGNQLIILGHVEDGSFAIRDSRGSLVSSIAIRELRELARENGVLLIEVGCNTASVGEGSVDLGLGVATRFNTVDAVRRMAKSLQGSKDLASFLEQFADESVQIVVDSKTIQKQVEFRAQYFETPTSSGAPQLQLAEVYVTTPPPSWMPSWLSNLFR